MIDGSQHLGMARVTPRRSIREDLTIKGFDPQEREDWTFRAYAEHGGKLLVPRAYAFANDFIFDTEPGWRIDPPERPNLTGKWAYQEEPVKQVVDLFTKQKYHDLILQAYTGSGKTVMGCEIAARLGVSTLILVDQGKLMQQWVDTLKDKFGYFAMGTDIGIVQGKTLDYEYDFTVAMIQSVYDRQFDRDFYEAFGTVLYDECHVAGATQFSRVLEMFPAQYRLGLSATPDRKDQMNKLIKMHLESRRVVLSEKRSKSRVYVVNHPACYSWYANTSPKTGRFISEVTEDGLRNELLVKIIRWMHEQDRKVLVIGERIAHLENLWAMALRAGVPEEATLLYTGKEHYYKLEKDPKPKGDPEDHVKGTEYTPLHFVMKERRVNLQKRDPLLDEARIIFSTYSVFSKGVDVPDLDAGLDVTPRSAFVQQHGRILRAASGKRIPIWVTIRDYNSSRAEYQFAKRIGDFVKSNAEVFIWPVPGEGELVRVSPAKLRKEAEWRLKTLKDERIITDAGGNCITQTRLTAPESSKSKEKRTTVKKGRLNRASRKVSSGKA